MMMDEETVASKYAREMMRVNEEILEVIIDQIKGHKKRLVDEGFDERAADAMCVTLHQLLLHRTFSGR